MLTVNLAPELEERIVDNAAELGQDTDQYLGQLINLALRRPVPPVILSPLTPQEQAEAFRRWATEEPHSRGTDTDTAYRREDIYDDDGR